MSSANRSAPTAQASRHVSKHYDLLTEVVDHLETRRSTFRMAEFTAEVGLTPLGDEIRHRLVDWQQSGILEVAERGDNHTGNAYRFTDAIWDYFSTFEPRSPQLPCSHHGFRNIGDGEYECRAEWCDETFDRATVEEALR